MAAVPETESVEEKKNRLMSSSSEEVSVEEVAMKKSPVINHMLVETGETGETGESEKKNLRLMSSDGKEVVVESAVAMKSQLIRHMIEADCADGSDVIHIPNVSAAALSMIFHYCEKHLCDTDINGDIKSFDDDFINVDIDTLYVLLMGSNYLDVKGLLDLACQKVAHIIKGKSPEEIRGIFNIQKDFTPEEEEEVKRENQWASE